MGIIVKSGNVNIQNYIKKGAKVKNVYKTNVYYGARPTDMNQDDPEENVDEDFEEDEIDEDEDDDVEEDEDETPLKTGRGRPSAILFPQKGQPNKEDLRIREREANRFIRVVKAHHLSKQNLTTDIDNPLLQITVAFLRCWHNEGILSPLFSTTALYRFLKSEVELQMDVEEKTFINRIKNQNETVEVEKSLQREIAASI